MKKLTILICLYCLTPLTQAQKFETNISISSAMTFIQSSGRVVRRKTNSRVDFGFSAQVNELYHLSDRLSLGLGLAYSRSKYKSVAEDFRGGGRIPEISYLAEVKLLAHKLQLPLTFRYKTKNNWFAQASGSFGYLLGSKEKIEFVQIMWYYAKKKYQTRTSTPVSETKNSLGRKTNISLNIELGKMFTIRERMFFVSTYYTRDLYHYTLSHPNSSVIYKLTFRGVGLKLGFVI